MVAAYLGIKPSGRTVDEKMPMAEQDSSVSAFIGMFGGQVLMDQITADKLTQAPGEASDGR